MSFLSPSELNMSKRTPRFPVKNHSIKPTESESASLITISQKVSEGKDVLLNYSTNIEELHQMPIHQLRNDEEVIRLIDEYDRDKSHIETDDGLIINGRNMKEYASSMYSKHTERYTNDKDEHYISSANRIVYIEKGPCRMNLTKDSSEIVEYEKVKGKNVPDSPIKITEMSKGSISKLERTPYIMSNMDTKTPTSEPHDQRPNITNVLNESLDLKESSKTNDTEKNADNDLSPKPSPIHQVIFSQDLKSQSNHNNSERTSKVATILDSQIRTSNSSTSEIARHDLPIHTTNSQKKFKGSPKVAAPIKMLLVPDPMKVKPRYRVLQIPKSAKSNDGSSQGSFKRHLSTSSSESSSNQEFQRTLSNSNNNNQSTNSIGISDSGSLLSLNWNSNHSERRSQKEPINKANSPNFKTIYDFRTPKDRINGDNYEAGSFSRHKDQMKGFMTQSQSYTSLNTITTQLEDKMLHSGSLAALNNNNSIHDVGSLCQLVHRQLMLNKHDRIKVIITHLIQSNKHDKIEDIMDHFSGRERSILMDIITKCGYTIKGDETIFEMTIFPSDFRNNLSPGVSLSSLNDQNFNPPSVEERMIYYRSNLLERGPPPIVPFPKPIPTNLLKSSIINEESLRTVDKRVFEVFCIEPTTFTKLISDLTADLSKDVEKVRSLFSWTTMYDLRCFNFDPAAPNDTLLGVLRTLKNGEISYNELFYKLCRYAGIFCHLICGYSKGAGYRPGMRINGNDMFRNVWASVYVAGAWWFVNCNWGARYTRNPHRPPGLHASMSSKSTKLQNLDATYRCDEFYFLTDPKQHIFENFPDKKRWQLLKRPISMDQFMALPIVKSPFFNSNLSFKRNYPETLHTKNGKVTIKVHMPNAISVFCQLRNKVDNKIIDGQALVRVLDNQMIIITTVITELGTFYLSIYIRDDTKARGEFELACSFKVNCPEKTTDLVVSRMLSHVGVLGSMPAAKKFNVIVNDAIDPFVIWDERSTLKLNMIISSGLKIDHNMTSYDRSSQTPSSCDNYALLQYDRQGRSHYHLRFPVEAFYCLTIFAGVKDQQLPDAEPTECIYKLLVDCRSVQDGILAFPRQTGLWVGFKLIEPLCQNLDLNREYRFRIISVHCSSIAIVINDTKWQDLTMAGEGLWKGTVNTGIEPDNLSVYGRFNNDGDDEEYVKLLDYFLNHTPDKIHDLKDVSS